MSGLEVFGVIAGAATLIEVLSKLSIYLNNFQRRDGYADMVANDLKSKLDQLQACVKNVEQVAQLRRRQTKEQGQEEIVIWGAIYSTLCQCKSMFESFEKAINEITPGKEHLNFLGRALLQRKIQLTEPKILKLEKRIDCNLTILNATILSVQL